MTKVNTTAIDKIKALKRDAEAIGGFNQKYAELIKNPQVDKHGFGFAVDDRFGAFTIKTTFASLRRYAGSALTSG